ncbi:CvpA family protein [Labrys monachus]|uniref:Membrane protein required for colicin V production n=1 Tax=Labrys monachus TaxID=217067 RepID=A0ABU0FFD0_9HYPH|nr:CvpA family protein [Labrys monachus]MDQ0392823.1 membrane protein required for colicin V production [Labrys monachus]
MPVTLLDLIVIGVMLISALLAMVRGFTREILAIAAWAIAAVAALFLHGHVLPYVKPYIKSDTVAQIVSGGAVFIVVLIIASFITIRLSDMILDSRIGAIDRTFGFLFGAARGLLLAVVAFIFFSYLVPDKSEPVWVQDAKSKPILLSGRDWLLSILPTDPENVILKQLRANDLLPGDSAQGTDPDAAGAPVQPATPATKPAAQP